MRTQRGPLAFRSRTSPAFQSCATRDRIGRSGTARLSCACDLPRRWSLRALLGGSVVGQVDDSPPVILEPNHALAQGDRFSEEALLPGGGDALVVTWVGQVARVASFPIETPGCPTDPADERAAEQATTTLGAP